MRVPGQKFFVPAIKQLAGMARSYRRLTQKMSCIEGAR